MKHALILKTIGFQEKSCVLVLTKISLILVFLGHPVCFSSFSHNLTLFLLLIEIQYFVLFLQFAFFSRNPSNKNLQTFKTCLPHMWGLKRQPGWAPHSWETIYTLSTIQMYVIGKFYNIISNFFVSPHLSLSQSHLGLYVYEPLPLWGSQAQVQARQNAPCCSIPNCAARWGSRFAQRITALQCIDWLFGTANITEMRLVRCRLCHFACQTK